MIALAGLGLAFLAGVLTILNPCVLPLVPVVVAGAAARDVRGPLALAAGLVLTFGLVGGLAAALGAELGDLPGLKQVAGIVMLAIGVMLVAPATSKAPLLEPLATIGNRLALRAERAGLWGQAALGALLALIWGPCVGPSLGAAILLAAGAGTWPLAVATMFVFASGAALSLLLFGFGLSRLSGSARSRTRLSGRIGRLAMGVVLLAVGLLALTGLDRALEAWLVSIMPDWLVLFATQV